MCDLPVPGPKPPVIADGGICICRTMKDGMALSQCVNSTSTIIGLDMDSADAAVMLAPICARSVHVRKNTLMATLSMNDARCS
jgi:hypothetical protein